MNDALFAQAVSQVNLPLRTSSGELVATLTLMTIPSKSPSPLADAGGVAEGGLEPVRVLEGGEYRYRIEATEKLGAWRADEELMSFDDDTQCAGRFRPRLRVGSLRLDIALDGVRVDVPAIEVVARKLGYLTDYQRMLDAIASLGAGLVLERFAASRQDLTPDFDQESTPYQRFRFLDGLLRDGGVREALQVILARPAVVFAAEEELRSASRGVRASASANRDLAKAGPRVPWTGHPLLTSVPRVLTHRRTEANTDTVPNRFVRFALEGWITMLDDLEQALLPPPGTALSSPVMRGLSELRALRAELEENLRHDVLHEASRLTTFPASNPTLTRRAGYREVFRAWLLTEAGAKLAWAGGEDVFGAGQKNVATLYEYWVFLELARILGSARRNGEEFRIAELVEPSAGGFNLALVRGTKKGCVGRFQRLGRELEVRFWFSRTFSEQDEGSSWTLQLRPDCTLEVTVVDAAPTLPLLRLHFDAKYKLNTFRDMKLWEPEDDDEDSPVNPAGPRGARPADLLKMHAYHDAIANAGGAYVVFPGDPSEGIKRFPMWTEDLPGLGAIPMRPNEDGQASNAAKIAEFLSSILDHVASQGSQHERLRYWEQKAFREPGDLRTSAMAGLTAPPADTRALLGYVRSPEQLGWVRRTRLYNIRADGSSGSVLRDQAGPKLADLLVIYGVGLDPSVELYRLVGDVRIMTGEALRASGYPSPSRELYLVLTLGEQLTPPGWLRRGVVDARAAHAALPARRAPFVDSWSALALAGRSAQ